ncbi:MAG: MAPEG family protein [Betaproteobacteria bacterium]|nr:MAPEG family protein [Betaproteobacteria bacterium]
MAWLDLVMTLCLIQLVAFSVLVGRARIRYGIKAPATSGNETFERLFRVQMNTLELLVVLIPAMWLAAKYWAPHWIAVVGVVYMIGRMLYLRAYLRDPATRSAGFAMSILPILGLLLSILAGIAMGV